MKNTSLLSFAFLALFSATCLVTNAAEGIKLTFPPEGSEQSIHNATQVEFITMPMEERRTKFVDAEYRNYLKKEGFIYPTPVKLEWENTDSDCTDPYTVTVSYDKNFAEGTCYVLNATDTKAEVDNLRIATKYYWKVQCGNTVSSVGTFVTDSLAPRFLRIPKMWNCRDIGGRIGLDGRRVKQDMIIRTGGLNNNAAPVLLTKEELEADPRFTEAAKEIAKHSKPLYETPQKEVPYLLDGEWTIFVPELERYSDDQLKEAISLTAIPQEFLGAKPIKKSPDQQHRMVVGNQSQYKPALFMKEFDSPKDGVMPFRCGGDFYWLICLNGNVLYDRITFGNEAHANATNYLLYLPVKKGKNLLTIPLGSGIGGFAWYIAPVEKGTQLKDVIAGGQKENAAVITHRFREYKLDENGKPIGVPGATVLNQEGLNYLLNTLKLKTEIDLRSDAEVEGMTGSPAGESIQWIRYSCYQYQGMHTNTGKRPFKEVFKVFLDEKNYPIDFHCIGGQDRTGSVAFVINALLGVEENELYLDWECNAFWNNSTGLNHAKNFDKLVVGFQKYPGDTIREKVENYILALGFTREDIQHLRDIMLE